MNGVKILPIPSDQWETTIEDGGCNQCVGQTNAMLLAQCDGALHHRLLEGDSRKVGEQTYRLL
jgi:hypothetical protein